MDALAPVPSYPQKSLVNTVASPVKVDGSLAVGTRVSVPIPRLFDWTKFTIEKDCPAPTTPP